jgi:hypothetical protein
LFFDDTNTSNDRHIQLIIIILDFVDQKTNMFRIQIFSLILIKSILIHSELFTSTTHLTQLLKTEIALAKKLETYLKEQYERLDHVEK